jgi:hypothetical protein
VEEEGYDSKTGKVLVKVDPQYFRPAEVECVASQFLVPFGFANRCSNTGFSSETPQKPSACLVGPAKRTLTNSCMRWLRPISMLPEASSRIKTKCLTYATRKRCKIVERTEHIGLQTFCPDKDLDHSLAYEQKINVLSAASDSFYHLYTC